MKKIVLGTVAGIAIGYFFRKIQQKGNFKKMWDDINGIGYKTKRKVKAVIDKKTNEANLIND